VVEKYSKTGRKQVEEVKKNKRLTETKQERSERKSKSEARTKQEKIKN
jgi:hypothetical protein